MNLNPPRQVRAILYLIAMFATPTILYLSSTGKIGDPLAVLFTSFVAIISGLALANTATAPDSPPPA